LAIPKVEKQHNVCSATENIEIQNLQKPKVMAFEPGEIIII
jgi:hypothetical protein